MLGLIEWEGQMVPFYSHEDEIPNDFPKGDVVAFENPQVLPLVVTPGVDDATVYRIIPDSPTIRPYSLVVPHRGSMQPRFTTGRDGDAPLLEPISGTILVVAVLVAVITIAVTVAFIVNKWVAYQAAMAIAHSGEIEAEWESDIDGDGIPDIRTIKYNNGRIVTWAISQAGVDAGVSVTPETNVDPEWDPSDINDILAGFWGQIAPALKWILIAGAVIGVTYVGVRAYQSVKTGEKLRFPTAERAVRGVGRAARRAGECLVPVAA